MFYYVGNAGFKLSVEGLLNWLLVRASSVGARQTIDDAIRFQSEDAFPCVFTVALTDLVVPHPVELTATMRMVPFSGAEFIEHGILLPDMAQTLGMIRSAVQLEVRHPKLKDAAADSTSPSSLAAQALGNEARHRLDEARLCLGLVKPSRVRLVAARTSLPPEVPLTGYVSSGSWSSVVEPSVDTNFDAAECLQAHNVCTAFLALDSTVRRRLRVPMDRLQSAVGERHKMVDSAIDIGISLESLLIDEHGTEIMYKLAMRGARLLGADREDRETLFALFQGLYTARSRAAHGGELEDKIRTKGRGHVAPRAVLDEGYPLAARAIRKVIEMGKIPDWDDLVMG
jgi:hypothetical protein